MNYTENIVEYYDELFPVLETQRKFYDELARKYYMPAKILKIGCGTGALEYSLAKEGYDVTGIESNKPLVDCANRRHRTQLMTLRYYEMSTIEMSRFLGKNFYNIVSLLDGQISFISDPVLLDKFFFDASNFLSSDGTLIIELFDKDVLLSNDNEIDLPSLESIRVKYTSKIVKDLEGNSFLDAELENSSGRKMNVFEKEKYNLWSKDDLENAAKKNGFSEIYWQKSFDESGYKLIGIFRR